MIFTGEQLQLLCFLKKRNQKTLAAKLFISQQAVSKFFQQKELKKEKFEQCVNALGISL